MEKKTIERRKTKNQYSTTNDDGIFDESFNTKKSELSSTPRRVRRGKDQKKETKGRNQLVVFIICMQGKQIKSF